MLSNYSQKHHKFYNTFTAWYSMKKRCNPNNKQCKKNYYDRGIRICDRWLNSFENFLKDMGKRPFNLTLDRIDNNKGYEPSNCRWATYKEQNDNTRRNHIIEYNGEKLNLSQWSKKLKLHRDTIYYRLRNGWSPEKSISTPPRH